MTRASATKTATASQCALSAIIARINATQAMPNGSTHETARCPLWNSAPSTRGAAGILSETQMPKQQRKYICDDCGHTKFEHFLIRNRAKRPQCPQCGSYWYDLKTKGAKDEAAALLAHRVETEQCNRPLFANTPKRSPDKLDMNTP